MNPCIRYKKKLALMASGVLEEGECQQLERHLWECPGCRQYWQEISAICREHSQVVDHLPLIANPEGFHQRLARRINSPARDPRLLRRPVFFDWLSDRRWQLAVATAVMVVLGLTILQFRSEPVRPKSIASTAKSAEPTVAPTDTQPTFLAYRLAADKSLDALDAMLTREAAQASGAPSLVTAAMREQTGLTD
jgi:hypothetical protein